MRNLVQFVQLNSLKCFQRWLWHFPSPYLSPFPLHHTMVFHFGISIVFFYFFVFSQLRVAHSWTQPMQNQSLSAQTQICSVGQGRIYLVHLQLARGVVSRGGGWGGFDTLRPKVTCSAPHAHRQCCQCWNIMKWIQIFADQSAASSFNWWRSQWEQWVAVGGSGPGWQSRYRNVMDGLFQP